MPIAVETSGVWKKQSYDFMVDFGRKISSITNDNRETSFVFQRFSIAIQEGMRFASSIVLTALFKMEQVQICLLSGPGL